MGLVRSQLISSEGFLCWNPICLQLGFSLSHYLDKIRYFEEGFSSTLGKGFSKEKKWDYNSEL
jgi:hypothetical protein